MPALKPISGHSASVRPLIRYLTKKERSLAADYINCEEADALGRETWRQMDETRHALGCDVAVGRHGNVRTYEHFVLSPDPRDGVTLDALRELATGWAEEHFGSYQVAIYYHDDNRNRIPHAHVVVNNANLDRPWRVSTMLTPAFEARIFSDLQRRAAGMGLRAFTPEAASENHAAWAAADAAHGRDEAPKETRRPTRTVRAEAAAARGEGSWKRDVRDRMACAVAVSATEEEFVGACRALGLGVSESRGRGAGEYVYAHPGRDTWRVRGSTLGRDWSRWGVQRRLDRDRRAGVPKPAGASRERLLAAIAALDAPGFGARMSVIGTASGREVTAAAVASMVAELAGADVRSLADAADAMREPMPPERRARLREAVGLARALGYLPESRDRIDGPRSTFEQRARARRAASRRGCTEARDAGARTAAPMPGHAHGARDGGERTGAPAEER